MFMNNFSFVILALLTCLSASAQGIILNSEYALPSNTLFENRDGTYLINNCGEIINEWPTIKRTDNHPKLLSNGHIVYINDNKVFEQDWDGNIVKLLDHEESNLMLDYEVIVLPSGNYLCIARRIENLNFFQNIGYDYNANGFPTYDDAIVEIDKDSGKVVWEWRISDHTIQDKDTDLENYGTINENPQLLNINAISNYDWDHDETFMINGMDYNPDLDQIVVSVRKMSEIAIIDHSTTTEQAKTSEGGKYGKGGDILYRWGNPQNYSRKTEADRKLYFQHNPNWVQYGDHKDKIIIYNNGLNRPVNGIENRYSTVEIVAPDIKSDGSYNEIIDVAYFPTEPDLILDGRILDFYSGYTSGAKVLPNGNIYITVGRELDFLEVTLESKLVWRYEAIKESYIFRSEKYPLDHPGFENSNTTTSGTVEFPSSNYDCTLDGTDYTSELQPEENNVTILHENDRLIMTADKVAFKYAIYNLNGRLFQKTNNMALYHQSETNLIASGLYIVHISNQAHSQTKKVFIK